MRHVLFLTVLLVLAGCSPAYRNKEWREPSRAGYRFDNLELGEGNTDGTFVCLTFSGGGTRAAALAYGVMQELRDTPMPGGRRLLDEVDIISSVSGGSFTAAAYGLWGEEMFDGRFEHVFLRRAIQTHLLLRIFSPRSLILLPYFVLDRIDVAADYFDTEVFQERRYADLVCRNRRPFIVINATNVGAAERFEFTQDDFDVLGSDLASVPIGYATAASSAVPLLFSPLRFRYYANDRSTGAIERIMTRPADDDNPRLRNWARHLLPPVRPGEEPPYCLDAERHKYLYLLDGGIADNLGLASIVSSYRDGVIERRLKSRGPDRIRRLVVIVVNAGARPENLIESRRSSPGLLESGSQSTLVTLNNYSLTLVQLTKMLLRGERPAAGSYEEGAEGSEVATRPEPGLPDAPHVPSYVIEVSFRAVEDEAFRRRLNAIRTTLELPQEQVNDLIRAGREILAGHPEYQRLLEELGK